MMFLIINVHFPCRENIALVKKWREAVGPDFPLMIDCYMSLTLPYAIELARKCEVCFSILIAAC